MGTLGLWGGGGCTAAPPQGEAVQRITAVGGSGIVWVVRCVDISCATAYTMHCSAMHSRMAVMVSPRRVRVGATVAPTTLVFRVQHDVMCTAYGRSLPPRDASAGEGRRVTAAAPSLRCRHFLPSMHSR